MLMNQVNKKFNRERQEGSPGSLAHRCDSQQGSNTPPRMCIPFDHSEKVDTNKIALKKVLVGAIELDRY